MFPKDCAGSRQSPIDISITDEVKKQGPLQIQWNNYENTPKTMTATNNGHTGLR